MTKRTMTVALMALLAVLVLLGAYSNTFNSALQTGGYPIGIGLNPRQLHIMQLALLMGLGTMLFFFFRRLMNAPWLAFFASVFFCIHTANTETMNIISAKSEILSTIGLIGSFLVYFFLPSFRRFFLYLIPMVAGAFANPSALLFAPLFFVYVFLFEGDVQPIREQLIQALKKAAPALGVGLLLLVVTVTFAAPSINYLITQTFVSFHYVCLFVFPLGLTSSSDWTVLPHWYDTRFFVGLMFLAVLFVFIRDSLKRPEMKPVAFGLIWFVLALLPTSSFFPSLDIVSERRVFIPFIGLTLAATWWIASCVRTWGGKAIPAAWILATLVIFGNAVGTFERNNAWKSDETLLLDVTQKSPTNSEALMNYGLVLMRAGKLAPARDAFEQALLYAASYPALEANLGIVYSSLGDFAKAEPHYQKSLQLDPSSAAVHGLYGYWLQRVGRFDEGIAQLNQAIALNPSDIGSRSILIQLYSLRGDKENLRKSVNETLALFPNDPIANKYAKELQNP